MAKSSVKRRGKRPIREAPILPEDITTDIFTRLPVKSLLRFRCLSKPFRALIDSPDFIKCQLNRSLLTKTNHKLILRQYGVICRFYSVDLHKPKQALELDHTFIKSKQPYFNIIGSVNGLLCLSNEKDDPVIWNFATGDYRKVPANEIEFPDYKCYAEVAYGFGYDSLLDDYKLLRLVRLYGDKPSSVKSEAKKGIQPKVKLLAEGTRLPLPHSQSEVRNAASMRSSALGYVSWFSYD